MLVFGAGNTHAADPPAEARAVAALALAKAPRVVGTTDWSEAKCESLARGLPFVVYLGCVSQHDRVAGTITANVAELSGYDAGTVVICYPLAGQCGSRRN